MNQYDVTVLYASHDPDVTEIPDFPEQTLSTDRIQVIKVHETDHLSPRKNSLKLLEQAEGRYVIMLDEGDYFKEPLLQTMIERMKDDAAFGMPALTMRGYKKEIEYGSLKIAKTFTIKTAKLPSIFPLDLHGTIFRTEDLREAASLYASSCEAEKRIILHLLEKYPTFLHMCSVAIKYHYPKEYDIGFTSVSMEKDWYRKPFEEFLLPLLREQESMPEHLPRILQFMTIYMIHIRFRANINNRNRHVLERDEVFSYIDLLSDVLEYVSMKNLLSNDSKLVMADVRLRMLDVRIKKRNYSLYPDLICSKKNFLLKFDDCLLTEYQNLYVGIMVMDYKDGRLEIDGEFQDLFRDEDISFYVRFNGEKYPVQYNKRFSLLKCFGVTYARMRTFHVSIPMPDKVSPGCVLQFFLEADGYEYFMRCGFQTQHSRLTGQYAYAYWAFDKYFSYWKKDGIHIVKRTPLKTLYKEIRFCMEVLRKGDSSHKKLLSLRILNFLLSPYFSRKKLWLFMDKIYKGGDSSEYIYRYAAKQHDGIKKYYLLDKNSADYARMRKEGCRPLVRGSLKHRLVFLNANMVIASNSTVFAFNDFKVERSRMIRGIVHFDVACVQHGMSVQKIALAQQRLRDNTKLYFCASKYEIENLSKPVYDYVGYDALKLTGVPRYDGLKDRAEKVILLSPTWRMNSALPVTRNEGVSRTYNPNFKETSYFQVYNSLINDPRLLEAARKYGYRIKYVLHPIVSPQYEDFDQNDSVELISAIGDMSYEKLFCESALMVTDFSGVQFDFAYMRKPVVYLHHESIPQHYEEGTFFYETMGFGEICHTNDELINVLCSYMKNECRMPDKYRARADDFFAFNDHNNCERIYKVMLEHEKNRDRRSHAGG